jgi:hypothetical protein
MHGVRDGLTLRRLTPTEEERLQAFPDGWTAGQADAHRQKQLGNAVCSAVAYWVGRRIVEVDAGRDPNAADVDLRAYIEALNPDARRGEAREVYALRSDAPRDGKARTPSPDAEGRIRLRDPGFTVEDNLAPTLDASSAHIVAA